jgi:uncharacterized protein (DUF433 family)
MITTIAEKLDWGKYIEMRNDRPHIRGRKLPVMFIVDMQRTNNFTNAEVAYQYTITEEQVLAALLYYREHQAEMDAQDAADLAENEAFFNMQREIALRDPDSLYSRIVRRRAEQSKKE